MKFVSKTFGKYNFEDIFNIDGKIQQIYIASAYSDSDTIRKIFNLVKDKFDGRGSKFKIFIDRSASKAILPSKERVRYRNMDTRIKNHLDDKKSGIYLVNVKGQLFHSKLIYIKTTLCARIVIGSINITQNGITADKNEEIYVMNDIPTKSFLTQILDYFKKLEEEFALSVQEDNQVWTSQSLRQFFLGGKLFVKLDSMPIFNFRLDLPEQVIKDKSTTLHPIIHQNVGSSINLLEILEINLLAKVSKDIDTGARWKKFCIETTRGFWTPKEYIEYTVDIINNISSFKITPELSEKLKKIDTEQYYNNVSKIFEEIKNNIFNRYGILWDMNQNFEKFKKWSARLKKRLYTEGEIREEIIQRITASIAIEEVPDFWDDITIKTDFEESFLESLEIQFEKINNDNLIIKALKYLKIYQIENIKDLNNVVKKVEFTKALVLLAKSKYF